MKKLLIILLTLSLFNCSTDDSNPVYENDPEATIVGRWILPGFESNFRLEFTETKRFDIYGLDGVFPTLEEFNEQNPQLTGLDWYYEGEVLVVDLNFGNFLRLTPEFTCNNYVVKWVDENGDDAGYYYRDGYDITNCDDL
ncbi:hypothetical protein RM697_09320 [Ichthyenterobacterium sp. W332]|uniref:Lipocalin-like domain-containing protein n=1 Tax=Microcosmobacter mediterraneus TaxID=3075607 RepID=A0ABU2YL01_9FLAO|nr:hypothetical protein [Ichthyenterobacterium sp. W332]MDT0558848.1 hypothetical protein [Ichthyenterobacterium sp. W332]